MLMIESTVRQVYSLDTDTKMPKKGQNLLVVPPIASGREPHVIVKV